MIKVATVKCIELMSLSTRFGKLVRSVELTDTQQLFVSEIEELCADLTSNMLDISRKYNEMSYFVYDELKTVCIDISNLLYEIDIDLTND